MWIATLALCQMIPQLTINWNGNVNFDSLALVFVIALFVIRMKR